VVRLILSAFAIGWRLTSSSITADAITSPRLRRSSFAILENVAGSS
jgi:hypothetical protein